MPSTIPSSVSNAGVSAGKNYVQKEEPRILSYAEGTAYKEGSFKTLLCSHPNSETRDVWGGFALAFLLCTQYKNKIALHGGIHMS